MSKYSYVGRGNIAIKLHGAAAGHIRIGNSSTLNIQVNENTIDLPNYTEGGGGNDDQVRRIQSVNTSFTMHNLSPENLARAVFGSSSAVASAAVTDESLTGYAGAVIPFANIPDPGIAVTITSNPAGTTYVEGTDYLLTPSGIFIIEGGGIADGTALLASYTKIGSSVIQALTESAKDYDILFEGLNEAKSDRPVIVRMHKVKLGAVEDLGLITDEFAGLQATGELLSDDSITGAGISKFFKAELASAA